MIRIRDAGLIALGVLGGAACNDQPTEPGPAELVIIQAPSTVGAPGWELIDTLIVRAVDPSGTPRAGVKVAWAVRQGGGSIAPTAAETDADGFARAVWTLGTASGVNQVRASTVEGSQADFESTGEAFRVDRVVSSNRLGCGLARGALWCWGLGFWATTPPPSLNPRWASVSSSPGLVDDSHGFVDLAVAHDAVCALDPAHSTWCATRNQSSMSMLAGVPPLTNLTGHAWSGYNQMCGLAVSDSTAWCWEIGGGARHLHKSPAFARIWTGPGLTCGLLADSTAACWRGSTDPLDTAAVVSGRRRFVELAVGRNFACGRTVGGQIWCWGSGGLPSSEPEEFPPIQLATAALRLTAEWQNVGSYSLGRTLTEWYWYGTVFEWPYTASGLEGLPIEGFAGNNSFSCVHLSDKQVYCYDDMWDQSSDIPIHEYSPVQPVRQLPKTSVSP